MSWQGNEGFHGDDAGHAHQRDAPDSGGWGHTAGEDGGDNGKDSRGGAVSGSDTGNQVADGVCRQCGNPDHTARYCPELQSGGGGGGGGLTGECYNCGEIGHNKADCTNPKVEREFTGTCNNCGEVGHQIRNCPTKEPTICRLCNKEGHRAKECTERRIIDWRGVPELDGETAWIALVDAAKAKDLDAFRTCLKAYARALDNDFKLQDVEHALRDDNLPIFLIGIKQEIAINMTIVDLIGNPDREFVLAIHFAAKPRRKKMNEGWPATPEENMSRLASAGTVCDRGVPLCGNCGELGHIRKHCKEEVVERENTGPTITCIYCHEVGHRARDCPKERHNPFACKNCGQEGHIAKECTEPRSAANVTCNVCTQLGHFSRDCPERERPACRNCGSTEHMKKDCDQPRNPDLITCRNCDQMGHMSRDCKEPKDWSRVKCSNCGEMGHTIKRCKAPIAEVEADAGYGGGDAGYGDANGGGGGDAAAGGWDNGDANADGAGAASWDSAPAGGAGSVADPW